MEGLHTPLSPSHPKFPEDVNTIEEQEFKGKWLKQEEEGEEEEEEEWNDNQAQTKSFSHDPEIRQAHNSHQPEVTWQPSQMSGITAQKKQFATRDSRERETRERIFFEVSFLFLSIVDPFS